MVPGGRGGAVGLWRLLVGPPLRAREASQQQIGSVEGLPALSLDALTSVAYGPEAIILVLAVAGAGALHLVLPITIAIVVLLAILVFSYRQVIDAYPRGGGADAGPRGHRQPAGGRRADRRLHPHGGGLDRRRGRLADLRLPEPDLGHSAPLPGHPGRDHAAQPARAGLGGAGVLAAHDAVYRRIAGRHRHRAHPPSGAARALARRLADAHAGAGGRERAAGAEGVLGRLQRPDRSGGDRQRGAAVQEAPPAPGQAD